MEDCGKKKFGRKEKEAGIECVNLESILCLNANIEYVIESMCMVFRGGLQDGYQNLIIVRMYIVLKATTLVEITNGVGTGRIGKRSRY